MKSQKSKRTICPECGRRLITGDCINTKCSNYWERKQQPVIIQESHGFWGVVKTTLWIVWKIAFYAVRTIYDICWALMVIIGWVLAIFMVSSAVYTKVMDNDRKSRILYQMENHPERYSRSDVQSIL